MAVFCVLSVVLTSRRSSARRLRFEKPCTGSAPPRRGERGERGLSFPLVDIRSRVRPHGPFRAALVAAVVALGSGGCSPTGNPASQGADLTPGSGASTHTGSGGGIDVGSGTGGGVGSGGSEMCIRIGMFGRRPSYGATPGTDGTDALQSWLDAHVKAGTTVDVVTTDTELTLDFLGRYDVILLQALEEREGGPYWSFSPNELAAFESWVRGGGGVIALTGYGSQPAEVTPTNQLLAFTGMAFDQDDVFGTCPDNCCYCAGSSIPVLGWHAEHPIAANISAVGAFHGRTISPGDADLVASEGTAVYGAAKQLDRGRVFLFFDEWVTYSSQWSGVPGAGGFTPDASCSDPNNTCYGRTAAAAYQVPQFWYNALKWAASDAGCFDFTSDVPIVR